MLPGKSARLKVKTKDFKLLALKVKTKDFKLLAHFPRMLVNLLRLQKTVIITFCIHWILIEFNRDVK